MSRFNQRKNHPALLYKTADVFAAACAAQRINEDYVKLDVIEYNPDDYMDSKIVKLANKKLVLQFLKGDFDITDADGEEAERVRSHYAGLTFKILQGKVLNDFEQVSLTHAESEEVSGMYAIAIISSLPSCYLRDQKRNDANRRLTYVKGGFIGSPKDKVTLNIEVIRCIYSQQWNTHYVTALTDNNQPVFFAYSEQIDPGTMLTISGSIKAHRDSSTQLSRVRIN